MSEVVGVNVAVVPEYVTAPGTAFPLGPVKVKVVVLIEAEAIIELKPALTAVLRTTPVAPFTGDVVITVGSAGLGACSRPHPAAPISTNPANKSFPTVSLRIIVSYSSKKTMQDPYHSRFYELAIFRAPKRLIPKEEERIVNIRLQNDWAQALNSYQTGTESIPF